MAGEVSTLGRRRNFLPRLRRRNLDGYEIVISPPERPTRDESLSAHRNVLIVALFAALGGMLYGYDTGIISGALPKMSAQWGIDHHWQEIVTAAILAGAVVGALVGGTLSKALGRRKTILIIACVFAVGVVACSLAVNEWMMAGCRFFLGLAVGGCSQIVPTYIAELAPPRRRGAMVTFFNIAIGVGIFLANLVSMLAGDAFEAGDDWRWMIGIAVLPALVLAAAMLRLPETPRWLIENGTVGKARVVLRKLRPNRSVAVRETLEIWAITQQERSESRGGWANLRQRWVRPALLAGLGIAAFTQLSGLEMMIYYSHTILGDAGFDSKLVSWSGLGIATVYLIFTAVGERLVDVIGRRRLMLILIPGATLFLFGFGALFVLTPHPDRYLTLTLMLAYMACNAAGLQAVGWLLGSELYPLSIRDRATSLHAVALWGSNLILTLTALTTIDALGIGPAFILYAGFNALSFIFVFFLVPETKGHSLEEIEQSLREGTFLPLRGNISSEVSR
ncbi:sugar porter family MFS transporter [Nocardia pseudobrasiliensis]|uniref:Sugar porter (SP) family MFS transporter n=1 Tax=Nocardia pseudobrasiliensis TaxID=45979 RepID=A0A370I1E5_9NOCA|nr:sugar porter family MFS transporter [Nocardia pseudobrasiliensis]RDI64559.1 sugar porter (SP) family MFS transporter [Nocardia pseudobrasiliensis]